MKQAEIQTKVLAGEIMFVGLYWGEGARAVTGPKGTTVFHEVTIMRGNESVAVSIPTPFGLKDPAQVKLLGFKKLAPVAVELTEYAHTKWGLRARGNVHPLES